VSRSLRRMGTAQAGFPRGRGRWVAGSVALALLLGGLLALRGPYGGPLTFLGSSLRILLLLLVAALPVAVLVWAWRRIVPWVRRVAPVVVGVLTTVLLLLTAAHADVFAERAAMSRDPAAQAAEAYRRSDLRFWAVEDEGQAIQAPPVVNRCIVNRYGVRVIPGATGTPTNAAHRRYLDASAERARRFNEAMLELLEIPAEEAAEPAEGFCPEGR
jgi:hypothetical protein